MPSPNKDSINYILNPQAVDYDAVVELHKGSFDGLETLEEDIPKEVLAAADKEEDREGYLKRWFAAVQMAAVRAIVGKYKEEKS